MRDLIILGTGVHGGEMAHLVGLVNRVQPTWNLLGHIAGKPATATEFAGLPILGGIEALDRYPQAGLVPDNEFPKSIPLPADRLVNLIAPDAYVHPTARLGRGSVIYPGCFIGLRATLGNRVFMLSGTAINHDDVVEDGATFASHAALAGHVHVEAGAYIGQSASVRQFLRIGRNSLIGMGAVVVKDVPPNVVMAGNPARKLRDRT